MRLQVFRKSRWTDVPQLDRQLIPTAGTSNSKGSQTPIRCGTTMLWTMLWISNVVDRCFAERFVDNVVDDVVRQCCGRCCGHWCRHCCVNTNCDIRHSIARLNTTSARRTSNIVKSQQTKSNRLCTEARTKRVMELVVNDLLILRI